MEDHPAFAMVRTLLNNKHSQPQRNIFTNQSKDQNRKTARAGDSRNVGQDKGHLENAIYHGDSLLST
jgi:hypothetical protein